MAKICARVHIQTLLREAGPAVERRANFLDEVSNAILAIIHQNVLQFRTCTQHIQSNFKSFDTRAPPMHAGRAAGLPKAMGARVGRELALCPSESGSPSCFRPAVAAVSQDLSRSHGVYRQLHAPVLQQHGEYLTTVVDILRFDYLM